jgi:hypothetical protein
MKAQAVVKKAEADQKRFKALQLEDQIRKLKTDAEKIDRKTDKDIGDAEALKDILKTRKKKLVKEPGKTKRIREDIKKLKNMQQSSKKLNQLLQEVQEKEAIDTVMGAPKTSIEEINLGTGSVGPVLQEVVKGGTDVTKTAIKAGEGITKVAVQKLVPDVGGTLRDVTKIGAQALLRDAPKVATDVAKTAIQVPVDITKEGIRQVGATTRAAVRGLKEKKERALKIGASLVEQRRQKKAAEKAFERQKELAKLKGELRVEELQERERIKKREGDERRIREALQGINPMSRDAAFQFARRMNRRGRGTIPARLDSIEDTVSSAESVSDAQIEELSDVVSEAALDIGGDLGAVLNKINDRVIGLKQATGNRKQAARDIINEVQTKYIGEDDTEDDENEEKIKKTEQDIVKTFKDRLANGFNTDMERTVFLTEAKRMRRRIRDQMLDHEMAGMIFRATPEAGQRSLNLQQLRDLSMKDKIVMRGWLEKVLKGFMDKLADKDISKEDRKAFESGASDARANLRTLNAMIGKKKTKVFKSERKKQTMQDIQQTPVKGLQLEKPSF